MEYVVLNLITFEQCIGNRSPLSIYTHAGRESETTNEERN